jgi:drug/metabolite transporter (DMT)-like permease
MARTEAEREEAKGLALVALSTLAFGVLPILGKVAYGAGVRPVPLLAWRYVVAALLFTLLRRGPMPDRRTRLRLWAIGAVFVGNSLAYFLALATVPASTVALLLYSYPVIVALLAAAVGLEGLTARSLVAALLAFAGCGLTAAGEGGLGAILHVGPGVLFALLCAFIYASYIVLVGRFAPQVAAEDVAQHLAQASAAVCAVLALSTGDVFLPSAPRAWLPVLGIAVVSTVVALCAFLAGMARVGPTRASVLSSLEVLVTLVLAFALLGERLRPWQWLGAVLILGAVAFQNLGALRRAATVPPPVRRPAGDRPDRTAGR